MFETKNKLKSYQFFSTGECEVQEKGKKLEIYSGKSVKEAILKLNELEYLEGKRSFFLAN